MTPQTKKILIGGLITLGALTAAGLLIHFLTKGDDDYEVTPETFNAVVKKAQSKHPSVYAWWDALPTTKQITIENSMTPELLQMLHEDFSNKNLSAQTLDILRRAGYTM